MKQYTCSCGTVFVLHISSKGETAVKSIHKDEIVCCPTCGNAQELHSQHIKRFSLVEE